MALADWLKFAALMDIILFLWYLRVVFRKNQGKTIERIADAMHFRGTNNFLKAWWASFLIAVSWRMGAGATSSPEAIAYGMFPTLMLAMLLMQLADCKLKDVRRESLEKSQESARAAQQEAAAAAAPTESAPTSQPSAPAADSAKRPMPEIRVPDADSSSKS